MKKKYIVTGILIIIMLSAAVKGVLVYQDYRSEKERMEQKPYFTKDKLTASEMGILDGQYHMKITPRVEEINKEDWPDYSYFTIEATEETEVVVTVLNYWLFDDRSELDRKGLEKAEEYGITTDNRMTVDWVMEHPRKAAEIMDSMANHGDIFYYLHKRIYPVYDEITGNSTEE